MSSPENSMASPESQEENLFTAALERPPSERAAFLDRACQGNSALRERLDALLAAHDATNALPEPEDREGPIPTLKLDLADIPDESVGQKIGPYKILERVGEGGCGVVYVAEQTEPVRRRVALKVIKPGMDTKQVVARFEAERQALAMMDHPNIAKVLDAGATETGRPYFVMELVRGIRITDYCDQNKLPTNERLNLFIQICHAIQHAHQKGIIHRDIKPSNILVTLHDGVPVPKVIDFGIAKATEGRLTNATVYTQLHQFIGTPAYMSPEQAEMSGLDIDTRSDIYSLGVLLYELLTGKTPFDAQELLSQGIDAMRRTIREKEPARPSTKLATLKGEDLTTTASRRSVESSKLAKLLRDDLDWIVMKCLEKDRTRRYETSNGLAADIKRHLNNEPVVACPPSAAYRFQKAFRRNKLAFTAAGAVAAALVIGIGISTWQAVRATRAEREQAKLRKRAEEAHATARRQEELANKNAEEARRLELLAVQNAEVARQQKSVAETQEALARRRFYAAQMNLAVQAWDTQQLARTLDLLETLRPKPGKADLRSFEWFHLWGLCNSRLRLTLRGSDLDVTRVTFSKDMKILAAAGEDGTVRLWETSSGCELMRLKNDRARGFSDIAFSPDGKTLVAGTWDQRVLIWNLPEGRLQATISPKIKGYVGSVAISPDGKALAVGSEYGEVKIFDLATQTEQRTFDTSTYAAHSLLFSRDGSSLITASGWGAKGTFVKIWDLKSDAPLPRLVLTGPRAIALSHDEKTLATVAWQPIELWDITTGQQKGVIKGNPLPVTALKILRDGRIMASGERTIQVWQVGPASTEIKEPEFFGAHLDGIKCLAVSEDESLLASGSADGLVKLWNLSETKEVSERRFATSFQCSKEITEVLPFPGNEKVLLSTWDGAEIRDLASGDRLAIIPEAIGRLVLTQDGSIFACASTNGTVRLFETSTGRSVASIQAHPEYSGTLWPLDFSPDARMLATGSRYESEIKLWDVKEGLKFIRTVPLRTRGVSAIKFSPDGSKLAAGLSDMELAIVDTQKMELERKSHLGTGDNEVLDIAFSSDGRLFASGHDNGAVSIWNSSDGRLHAALRGHTAPVNALSFAPDGATLATGGDMTVRLWDVATGQERMAFKRHRYPLYDLAFTPDGNAIISGYKDGTIRVFRAPRSIDEIVLPPAKHEQDSSALRLNGVNQYAQLPANLLTGVTNFTIAVWVSWDGGDPWQRIFDFGNGSSQYMFLSPSSHLGTMRFAISTNGNNFGAEQMLEFSQMPVGEWRHVAVTRDGNATRLYLNGKVVASGSTTIAPASFNPAHNYLGASQYEVDPLFKGQLDQMFIYNYALSDTEITLLMNNPPMPPTVPTRVTQSSSGSALLMSWPANQASWRLESNPISLQASNSWITVNGSALTNWATTPNNSSSSNIFFRLVYR